MLATYTSYEGCWAAFRAVCWQPTGLIRAVASAFRAVCWQPTGLMLLLGLYVGNLQVL